VDDFKAVFRSAYWDSLRCDNLPWPVNLALADFAYHSGNQKATRVLQHALIEAKQQVEADGRMGEETIAAVKNVDAKELALNLCAWRIEFLQDLCEQKPAMGVFQAGWLKRVKRLMEKIG
jgi:lysozyme family protein